MEPTVSFLGERAVRLVRPLGISARALLVSLRREPHVVDVVVTEEHVAIYFDSEVERVSFSAQESLARAVTFSVQLTSPKDHVISVVYDGEDLRAVAETLRRPVEEVIERHLDRTYTVKMIGFLPGFAYLGDLDEAIVLPRRASPRTRVPAMSVAIAGPYTSVYPFVSPGGWHLLGRATQFPTFELELGDRVRFERSREEA